MVTPIAIWQQAARRGDRSRGDGLAGRPPDAGAAGWEAGGAGCGAQGEGGHGDGRAGTPGPGAGQGGEAVGLPHHVAHHEHGQDQGEQREAAGGGRPAHRHRGMRGRCDRAGGQQHVHHGAAHHEVRHVVAVRRRASAGDAGATPAAAPGPPPEPAGTRPEHHRPDRVRERVEPAHQHACHGHAHHRVHQVDGALIRPPVRSGDDQPGGAVRGGYDHDRGQDAREPGRSGHVRVLPVAGPRMVRAPSDGASSARAPPARAGQ